MIYVQLADLFFNAANERDPVIRDSLISHGLELVRDRKSTFYKGVDEVYNIIEDLFLNIEGIAVWSGYLKFQALILFHLRNFWKKQSNEIIHPYIIS